MSDSIIPPRKVYSLLYFRQIHLIVLVIKNCVTNELKITYCTKGNQWYILHSAQENLRPTHSP